MQRLVALLPSWVNPKTTARCASCTAAFGLILTVAGFGVLFTEMPYRRTLLRLVSASMVIFGVLLLLATVGLCFAWRVHSAGRPSVLVIRVPTISAGLLASAEAPPPPYDTVVQPPPSYESVVSIMLPENEAVEMSDFTHSHECAQRF